MLQTINLKKGWNKLCEHMQKLFQEKEYNSLE